MSLFRRSAVPSIGPINSGEADLSDPPFCAVDREGKRYTTATGATRKDWWYGATILTPSCIRDLGRRGLLPLTEVQP